MSAAEEEIADALVAAAVMKRVEQLTASRTAAVAAFVATTEVMRLIGRDDFTFALLDSYLELEEQAAL